MWFAIGCRDKVCMYLGLRSRVHCIAWCFSIENRRRRGRERRALKPANHISRIDHSIMDCRISRTSQFHSTTTEKKSRIRTCCVSVDHRVDPDQHVAILQCMLRANRYASTSHGLGFYLNSRTSRQQKKKKFRIVSEQPLHAALAAAWYPVPYFPGEICYVSNVCVLIILLPAPRYHFLSRYCLFSLPSRSR